MTDELARVTGAVIHGPDGDLELPALLLPAGDTWDAGTEITWDSSGIARLRMLPGAIPDGPVELWFAAFSEDSAFMGAARVSRPPAWQWRGGMLALDYSPVKIIVQYHGTYRWGVLCAVHRESRTWRALVRVGLGPPYHELRPGDDITVTEGIVAFGSWEAT